VTKTDSGKGSENGSETPSEKDNTTNPKKNQ
jgi:hypothetical protein